MEDVRDKVDPALRFGVQRQAGGVAQLGRPHQGFRQDVAAGAAVEGGGGVREGPVLVPGRGGGGEVVAQGGGVAAPAQRQEGHKVVLAEGWVRAGGGYRDARAVNVVGGEAQLLEVGRRAPGGAVPGHRGQVGLACGVAAGFGEFVCDGRGGGGKGRAAQCTLEEPCPVGAVGAVQPPETQGHLLGVLEIGEVGVGAHPRGGVAPGWVDGAG